MKQYKSVDFRKLQDFLAFLSSLNSIAQPFMFIIPLPAGSAVQFHFVNLTQTSVTKNVRYCCNAAAREEVNERSREWEIRFDRQGDERLDGPDE